MSTNGKQINELDAHIQGATVLIDVTLDYDGLDRFAEQVALLKELVKPGEDPAGLVFGDGI
jgi:hypothetical protein